MLRKFRREVAGESSPPIGLIVFGFSYKIFPIVWILHHARFSDQLRGTEYDIALCGLSVLEFTCCDDSASFSQKVSYSCLPSNFSSVGSRTYDKQLSEIEQLHGQPGLGMLAWQKMRGEPWGNPRRTKTRITALNLLLN